MVLCDPVHYPMRNAKNKATENAFEKKVEVLVQLLYYFVGTSPNHHRNYKEVITLLGETPHNLLETI